MMASVHHGIDQWDNILHAIAMQHWISGWLFMDTCNELTHDMYNSGAQIGYVRPFWAYNLWAEFKLHLC